MLIMTLDPARRSGYAIGPAGDCPRQGFLEVRKSSEHRAVGCGNMIAYLDGMFRRRKPDLLAYEPPMSIEAWINQAKSTGRWHGGGAIQSASELNGCIMGLCERYGIRFEHAHRPSVLRMLTGKQGFGSGDANKAAVLQALKDRRMIPQDCRDHDLADAVAIHVYASAKWAKVAPANIGLFSPKLIDQNSQCRN